MGSLAFFSNLLKPFIAKFTLGQLTKLYFWPGETCVKKNPVHYSCIQRKKDRNGLLFYFLMKGV